MTSPYAPHVPAGTKTGKIGHGKIEVPEAAAAEKPAPSAFNDPPAAPSALAGPGKLANLPGSSAPPLPLGPTAEEVITPSVAHVPSGQDLPAKTNVTTAPVKEDPVPLDHSLNVPSTKGDGGASGALAENADPAPAAPSIGDGTEHTMEGSKGDPLDPSNWWDEADVPGDKTAHDGDAKVDDASGPHTASKHGSGSAADEGDGNEHSKGGTSRAADEGDDRGSGASDKDDGAGRVADEGDDHGGAPNEDNGTDRSADTGDDRGSGASDEDNGTVRATDARDNRGSGVSDKKDDCIGETPLTKWDACEDAYQVAWDLANASMLNGEAIIPMLDNENDRTLEELNNMFLQ